MNATPTPARILVVKLADIGDVLTATPALRALRQSYPLATIDLLLTHHTRPVMQYSKLVNRLIPSDNFRFFSLREALKPGLLREGLAVLRQIRRRGYDTVVILHHLTTWGGALKYATIAKASGARVVAGLDPGGKRGGFLTHAVSDAGFGGRHEIDHWLEVVGLVGAAPAGQEMELAVSEVDRAWIELVLALWGQDRLLPSPPNDYRSTGKSPLVVIHPGSGGFNPARRWSPANFARVADALSQEGAQVVLVGRPTDGTEAVLAAMETRPIDLTGQTTLHQLAALLQRADLFIGGDAGVTHIAAASGAPMVIIFGPTNAAAWGPVGPKRCVLQAEIPCGPCAYVGHTVGLRTGCSARTCLKLVTPAQVLAEAEKLLAGDKHLDRPPSGTFQSGLTTTPTTTVWPGRLKPMRVDYPAPPYGEYYAANILGVRVHALTFVQAIALIEAFIANGQPHQITTVNPEFVVAAQKDALFRRIINRSALALADGIGVLNAARWLNQPALPERIAGVEVVEALAVLSAQKGYRLYFLGAQPGVAERTSAVLEGRYPGLATAGCFAGSPQAEDEELIVAKIQAARPDIIFVAYGAPNQDKWIARNMVRLPAAVLIGVGGAFDFISGGAKRAPGWVQRLGLEWLHRFLRQPSRWRRVWNAVPRFLWLVWLARRRQEEIK